MPKIESCLTLTDTKTSYVTIADNQCILLDELINDTIKNNSFNFKNSKKKITSKCSSREDLILDLINNDVRCEYKEIYGGRNNLNNYCPKAFIANVELTGENEIASFECISSNFSIA
jgi:hypothetical protein